MLCPNLWRFSRRFSLLAFLLAFTLASSLTALAQTTVQTGSIVGTVSDPSGAAVPSAKVVITNTSTGQNTELSTNSAGVYNAGALVPGVYKVQVTAKGFSTASETLTVQVSNTANGDVRLQVGQGKHGSRGPSQRSAGQYATGDSAGSINRGAD